LMAREALAMSVSPATRNSDLTRSQQFVNKSLNQKTTKNYWELWIFWI
jgi:hypothetical protein